MAKLKNDALCEAARQLGSRGGYARAKKLTAEQRSEAARHAVSVRHAQRRSKKEAAA